MKVKILTSSSATRLNEQIDKYISEGWSVKGSHQVVESHRQNRYAGKQHMDTTIQHEYSITVTQD